MQEIMDDMVRQHVWHMVPDAAWAQRWEEVCPAALVHCTLCHTHIIGQAQQC